MSCAVAITVDVDGEAGLPDGGRGYAQRLTSRSERLYGPRRGLPRILALLEDAAVEATFFVPGVTARRHPDAVRRIARAGHEIGHHGYAHRRLYAMTQAEQRRDLDDGIAALNALTGAPPRGYRAPGWELTPCTLRLLGERGFAYDSSLMGDDRPYTVAAGTSVLVELPVHWSLDDAPHFASTTDPRGLEHVWLAELEIAARESRPVIFTLHPEILGRPHRIEVLRHVLDSARALGATFASLGRLASAHLGEQLSGLDAKRAGEPHDRRQPGIAHPALEA